MKIIMLRSQTPEGPLVEAGNRCPGWPPCLGGLILDFLHLWQWGEAQKHNIGYRDSGLVVRKGWSHPFVVHIQRPQQGLKTILKESIWNIYCNII